MRTLTLLLLLSTGHAFCLSIAAIAGAALIGGAAILGGAALAGTAAVVAVSSHKPKPGKPHKPNKPGGGGGHVIGNQCYQHNVDYWGHDYKKLKNASLGQCSLACRQDPRCRAFTFRGKGYCWLKDAVGQRKNIHGAISGLKSCLNPGHATTVAPTARPLVPPNDCYKPGRFDGPFRTLYREIPGGCMESCRQYKGCTAFTFHAHGLCEMFSNPVSMRPWNNALSGRISCIEGNGTTAPPDKTSGVKPPLQPCVLKQHQLVGKVVDVEHASKLSHCVSLCWNDYRCVAVSWDKSEKECSLLSKVKKERLSKCHASVKMDCLEQCIE